MAKLKPRLALILFAGAALLAASWPHTSHATLTIKITQGLEGAQPIAIVPFGLQQGSQQHEGSQHPPQPPPQPSTTLL